MGNPPDPANPGSPSIPRNSGNPLARFSSRVGHYLRYRPSYPPDVIRTLQTGCGLTADSVIADIGSGTGILSELFLKHGNMVFGVEPNREMREAGALAMKGYAGFRSVTGTAETTTLDDGCANFVAAGQSFHWFNRSASRREFLRILKPDGHAVIVWNDREKDATPFMRAYESVVEHYNVDFAAVDHTKIPDAEIAEFFGAPEMKSFRHSQKLDRKGFEGLLLSASYMPEPGDERHPALAADIDRIFGEFNSGGAGGTVEVVYRTRMYYGRLGRLSRHHAAIKGAV